jgi:DNA repair exonuclease SbcCD ATPase subunit
MALEVQMERMRLTEAMKARDATIQRLADAYTSIRQKNATIEQLQREKDELARNFLTIPGQRDGGRERVEVEIKRLEGVVQGLREEIKTLRNSGSDLPPTYEEGTPLVSKVFLSFPI